MLIISSSAKTLDYDSDFTAHVKPTRPVFEKQADEIRDHLAALNPQELATALHASEKIAALNFERYQNWSSAPERPALFAYKGDVFREMNPHDYSKAQCEYAQDSVHTMSGIYGVVRAFDLIKPYRLELKLKLAPTGKLSDYWSQQVTDYFNQQIQEKGHTHLLNLASLEYSAAVDSEQLLCPIVDVDFKETVDGKLKTVGLFAKRARGMMIEYCVQNQVTDPSQLRDFKTAGYEFMGEEGGRMLFGR